MSVNLEVVRASAMDGNYMQQHSRPIQIEPDLSPRGLGDDQIRDLKCVLKNDKTEKIVYLLLDRKGLYLNEIHDLIGGSKTTTVEALKSLENHHIIKSSWKIEELKGTSGPKTRAVKAFELEDSKLKLFDIYSRLIKYHE